jgi:hypothetical protein
MTHYTGQGDPDPRTGAYAVSRRARNQIARTRSFVATGAVLAGYLGDLYRRSTRQTTPP